jgi:general L-amino acid transport system permease protein
VSSPGERTSPWTDPRIRAVAFQLLAVAAVVALFAIVFDNTLDNLSRRGIRTGFGFFDGEAGFGILMSLIPYTEASTYGRAFVVGLLNTLLVSALGIVAATALGLVVGIARVGPNWLIARLAGFYIETVRNIPLLLQLFFWYFAVLRALPLPRDSLAVAGIAFLNNRGFYVPAPIDTGGGAWVALACVLAIAVLIAGLRNARRSREAGRAGAPVAWAAGATACALPIAVALATGFATHWSMPELAGFNFRGGVVLIPEFVAMLLALSIYTAAYIAEVVRAGLQSVGRGQVEAAQALGLTRGQTLRLVVVPQALRVIIPPLTNQYLNLTKNSSLAAAIAYPELVSVFAGTVLNQTGQAVVVIGITMAVYLAISLAIALGMNIYNRRTAIIGGRT